MRKILYKVLVCVLTFILAIGAVPTYVGVKAQSVDLDEDEYENLLSNGDAEDGIDYRIWKSDKNDDNEIIWMAAEPDLDRVGEAKELLGSKCFWPVNAEKGDSPTEMYQDVYPKDDFKAGSWLRLSAFMAVYKQDDPDKAILRVEIRNDDNEVIDYKETYTQESVWNQYILYIKIPADANKVRVICEGEYHSGSWKRCIDTYFDNIELVAIDKPYNEVIITGERYSGKKGEKFKLKASDGEYTKGSDYEWSTSDANIAVVNKEGEVTIIDDSKKVVIYARNKKTGIVGSYIIISSIDILEKTTALSGFTLEKDNNNFVHYGKEYYLDKEKNKTFLDEKQKARVGFLNAKDHSFSDKTLLDKLTKYCSDGRKAEIVKQMQEPWDGACYGLSATMTLVFEGKMSLNQLSDEKVKCYYDLKRPADNKKLLDWINYLYLSQLLGYGGMDDIAIATISKNISGYDSEQQFFAKLVEYSSSGKVSLLNYFYEYEEEGERQSGGHTVIVTGCVKNDDNSYTITIYDQNSVKLSQGKEKINNINISSDFQLIDSDVKHLEDFYCMNLGDVDKLYKYVVEQKDYTTTSKVTCVSSSINNKFRLIDKKNGKSLAYECNDFSGNIEVKGLNFATKDSYDAEGDGEIMFYLDPIDNITFTDLSEQSDISVYNDDDYASFAGTNIEEAHVELGNGVELKGTNMEFETYVLTEDDEKSNLDGKLIKISGNATSDVNFTIEGSNLIVKTDGTLDNVVTSAFEGTAKVERAYTGITNEFKIDTDAKVDNATEVAMIRTEGNSTLESSGNIEVFGVSGTVESNSIANADIKLSKDSYVYNGKKKNPSVTVELNGKVLSPSKDYKVTYKNNKKVGTATVTVKGIGNYKGTVTQTFLIVPKGTSLSKVSNTDIGILVKWKKQSKSVTGYEMEYSTKKSFPTKSTNAVTISGAKKTKTTITGLKSGKKYYFRVRTYKVIDGKKYYSRWSKIKNVKAK